MSTCRPRGSLGLEMPLNSEAAGFLPALPHGRCCSRGPRDPSPDLPASRRPVPCALLSLAPRGKTLCSGWEQRSRPAPIGVHPQPGYPGPGAPGASRVPREEPPSLVSQPSWLMTPPAYPGQGPPRWDHQGPLRSCQYSLPIHPPPCLRPWLFPRKSRHPWAGAINHGRQAGWGRGATAGRASGDSWPCLLGFPAARLAPPALPWPQPLKTQDPSLAERGGATACGLADLPRGSC